MKKIIIILFLILATAISSVSAQVKSAVYWTAPTMSLREARSIAKFDLAIIDLENMINNHASLDSLKKWNPQIKLICYSNPMEIFVRTTPNRKLQNNWTKTIKNNYPQWLLRTNRGKQVVFYPGMKMLNLSSFCPIIKGQNYTEFMDSILINQVLSDSIWNGYFMDNGSPNIYWVYHYNGAKIDANNDGLADGKRSLNQAWSQGIYAFLKTIRKAKGKKFILIANRGVPVFMDILNGRMFEGFPNNYLGDATDNGWWQSMVNAQQTGDFTIFQVKLKNLNLAIVSAELINHPVYIAVEQNNSNIWTKPNLKQAGNIIIQRNFKNGLIKINPAKGTGEIFKKY